MIRIKNISNNCNKKNISDKRFPHLKLYVDLFNTTKIKVQLK